MAQTWLMSDHPLKLVCADLYFEGRAILFFTAHFCLKFTNFSVASTTRTITRLRYVRLRGVTRASSSHRARIYFSRNIFNISYTNSYQRAPTKSCATKALPMRKHYLLVFVWCRKSYIIRNTEVNVSFTIYALSFFSISQF